MDWTWMIALVLLMLLDISGHRQLARERQYRHQVEQRIAALGENLPVVVYRAREHSGGRIELIQVLGDAMQLFSATAAELRADPRRMIDAISHEDRRHALAGIRRGLTCRQPAQIAFRSRGVQGCRHVLMRAWPSERHGGLDWSGYWMDDTASHRRAAATENERERAAQQAMARDRLMQVLGTSIQAPMHSLEQAVSALRRAHLPTPQHEAVQALSEATQMLAQLMDEASGVADASAASVHRRPVELRSILMQVKQLLLPVANRKGLDLVIQSAPAVASWLLLDGTRLQQVLLNLLGNAVKFTAHGHVCLRVEVLDDDGMQQHLQLTISDSGIGIAADRIDQVFEPYRQAEASTARQFGGTGLGLGICRQLIHAMGGQMQLYSTVGVGTEVIVSLQAMRAATPLPALAPVVNARVLVADDHPAHQLMVQWWLLELGLEAMVVPDGEQAMQAWRQGRFELLICDEQMPGMSGSELAAQIRREERADGRAPISIIGMSADIEHPRPRGIDWMLAKTGGVHDLQIAIDALRPGLLEVEAVPAAVPPKTTLETGMLQARFGSAERVQELLNIMRRSLEEDIQALQREVSSADASAVKARLHRVAGALGSVGAVELAEWLRALQPPLSPTDLQAVMAHLQDYLRQLQAATA